jgi:hypothetical protein
VTEKDFGVSLLWPDIQNPRYFDGVVIFWLKYYHTTTPNFFSQQLALVCPGRQVPGSAGEGLLINTEIFRFAQDDKLWWVQLFKSCHAVRSEASPY